MGRRVGLLGGTFDPPHIGHLWLAETAREQLALDQVWFMPVGQPPHKEGREITAVSHRLAMTRLAVQDNLHFHLNAIDAEREPPHTTATLLPLLHAAHPDAQFWLIVGGDSLRDLPTWIEPEKIIRQCRLAAYPRPGYEVDWRELKTAVPGVETAVDQLSGPTIDVSSTEIRQWVGAGHTVRYLTPLPVHDYIRAQKLYRQPIIAQP